MPQISEKEEEDRDEGHPQTMLSYEAGLVLQRVHGEDVLSRLRGLHIQRQQAEQQKRAVKESIREVKAQKRELMDPSIARLKDLTAIMPRPPLRPPTSSAAVDQSLYREALAAHKECVSACKSAILSGSGYLKGRFTLSSTYSSSHFQDTYLCYFCYFCAHKIMGVNAFRRYKFWGRKET